MAGLSETVGGGRWWRTFLGWCVRPGAGRKVDHLTAIDAAVMRVLNSKRRSARLWRTFSMAPPVCLGLVFVMAVTLAAGETSVKLRLRTPNGEVTQDVPLERYVAGVLAGESSVFKSNEALKAMAVAARSYAVRLRGRHSAEGFDFCATTHCQRFDPSPVTPRLQKAVDDTRGELLWFEGKPAFACYTRDCGGRTEDAAAVWPDLAAPYLASHDDPYCKGAGQWRWSGTPRQLAEALARAQLRSPRTVERVEIVQRTASGRARMLTLIGAGQSVRISASSFRFAVGREIGWNTVLSDLYEVRGLTFQGSGSGHGVGLCQRGADEMGAQGRTYREILAFYYPGTAVGLTGAGISWQRISGERITLLTTHPGQDGAVLASAERQLRSIAERTHFSEPDGIEIRVYPDVEAFRNATGEPGWVAAHTEGRRISLQPASVLRNRGALDSTLKHELTHALLEANATARLPVWFREGLAEYLAGTAGLIRGLSNEPREIDLRQTADRASAQRAYAEASRAVASLVARYGETMVLGWLKTGLPPDVTNANSSQPNKKSK